MPPLVSICLPTLNSVRFLKERIDSIKEQTLTDWEVIAFDSYSNDGTAEMLDTWSQSDSRVTLHRSDPDGIYTNINRCIRKATGQYVYIATSDDTMAPDCLKELAQALNDTPTCGLAHCMLKMMDENSEELRERNDQWRETSVFARSCGELLDENHLRQAPFDGLLHAFGSNVYISLTQILIRRSLFDEIGHFQCKWGSIGDFAWGMRAGLQVDTIHVPGTWAGWRIHSTQATHSVDFKSAKHRMRIREMITDSLTQLSKQPEGSPLAQNAANITDLLFDYRVYRSKIVDEKQIPKRILNATALAFQQSPFAIRYLKGKIGLGNQPFDPVDYLIGKYKELTAKAPISLYRKS